MAKLTNKGFNFPSSNSKAVTPVPPRYAHYVADNSGCGYWRMNWVADALSIHKRAIVSTLHQMVLDPRFYGSVRAVRLQRQCKPEQYNFVRWLRKVSNAFRDNGVKNGLKIIWEVDDLIGPPKDLPDYNKAKENFVTPNLLETAKRIVVECDEVTVVSKRMAEHYKQWFGYEKISVIPNYMDRNWADGYYDPNKVMMSYDKNRKRPRVGYAGAPLHFDVAGRNGGIDDFSHVVEEIIKRVDDYQFVMFGGYPKALDPLVRSGKIEYHPWTNLSQYMRTLDSLDLNVTIAPLHNNPFSASKSNIKLLEAGALGIPCICQDIEAYEDSPWKFSTGEELFDKIDLITLDENIYKNASDLARSIADDNWLDNHLDEIQLIYDTEYGSEERMANKYFLKNNIEQFDKPEIPTYPI